MGGSTTSSQKTDTGPWKKQQPFLVRGFREAEQQFEGDKPQYFPGSTVVPYAPETEEALGLTAGQARDPGSLVNLAGTELGRTMRGDYLSADNPVFQNMMQGINSVVRPGVDTAFASRGRFGSPLHAGARAEAVTRGMLPYLTQERGRQYDAIGQAPGVSQYGPGFLRDVGGAREAKSREGLGEDISRFNFEQNIDAEKLRQFMGLVTGNYGRSGTSTATPSPWGVGLDTASTVGKLFRSPTEFSSGGFLK